jgi:energy-coupling factor transport system permease protein
MMTVFMAHVFHAERFPSFLLLLCVTLLVAGRTGASLKHALKGLKAILFIALFTMVINTFAVKGTPLCGSGLLSYVSREGIILSVQIVLRLFLLLSGASLLTSTTTPISLMEGLESLLKPLKRFRVPVHEVVMMLAIALRFVPVLLDEAERIFKAQASRNAEFAAGGPLHRARSCVPVLVPLFAGAFRRADELAAAMESRCYGKCVRRTGMRQLSFSWSDSICVAVMIALTSALICIEYAP